MTITTPTRRSLLVGGLATLLLPGAAFPQNREVEGGIGGTGIVGVLVDFGSLYVAGHRVETTGATEYVNSFGRIAESQVRVGDSLTVEAATDTKGQLFARRVQVDYPLVGRITDRSSDGRRLTVNGVEVLFERRQGGARVGARVAVSGLWSGGRVIGSRLSPAPGPRDLISGTVDRPGGRALVSGVPVRGGGITGAQRGSFAAASGLFVPTEGALIADRVVNQRFVGAAGPLKQLSIEGWLEPTREAPGFRVAGLGHSFARNLRLDPLQGQRLLLQGGYNGRFRVETALRLPDATGQRRSVLRSLGSD